MIRNVVTLTLNDLAIAFHNKTLLLVLFIPLFIFLSLKFVDPTEEQFRKLKIGLLQNTTYTTDVINSIESADMVFEIIWLSDKNEADIWLREKKLDGILANSAEEPGGLSLIVLTKSSFQTLAIVESVSALQNALERKSKNWIADIQSIQQSGVQKQTLPVWVLMLVLLVGFIILPTQVAEEKEKKLLLGLMQTPINEAEWLIAKLLLGIILVCLATGFLQLLGQIELDFASSMAYVAFLIVGGFCFSAFGILLGFICRTQASARTLGVLFYMPNLLPAALSDFSAKLTNVAPLFPSHHLYGPVKAILLEGAQLPTFYLDWVYLLLLGAVMVFLSWLIMRKRWLM